MTKATPELIERLRSLRAHGRRLHASLAGDLPSFQRTRDLSFFTLPDSEDDGKISVATTCTVLMALIDSNDIYTLLPPDEASSKGKVSGQDVESLPQKKSRTEVLDQWRHLFSRVVRATWASSGLRDLNPFTSCMVVRATGFLISSGVLTASEAMDLKHVRPTKDDDRWPPSRLETELSGIKQPSLKEIISAIAEKAPQTFAIPGYPAKSTLAYWFVDGIAKAEIDLIRDHWENIAKWAAQEFYQQLTYVVSGNDPLMDPASLAMAACVINRIRETCAKKEELSRISKDLPSRVELTHAIGRVFEQQTDSGVWHKSFPLFHFPKSGAADYCFSFEFLEAVLIEFSEFDILARPAILEGIEKAVQWCDNTRFTFRDAGRTFCGWNAGGEVTRLAAGMPEAWATSVVHMFLWELDSALSQWLQKLILEKFHAEWPSADKWNELIDVDLHFPGEDTTLTEVAEKELIGPAVKAKATEQSLRKRPLADRRSALLFGPPGTSKTSFAKAIAGRLTWALLIITPSEFLSMGLEQIYVRATEVFQDLMDLSGVVILFDEMDALAQTRGNAALDVTRQLLTTSMLPKADLHDRARVIFFMATNHKKDLDPAITRPGRFDLLLCVGPPNWDRKLKGTSQVLKGSCRRS
jgi:ATPase family protein associated with various cellular activities (AAA)